MGLFGKKNVGDLGELTAIKFLKRNKYKILETNYNTKYGEIDIICEDKDYLVFVEVKTRKTGTHISGVYSVNKNKQLHILRTASVYLKNYNSNKQPRFDIIEVEHFVDGTYSVKKHYINAFIQGGSYGVF